MPYIILIIFLALALALQILTGNFPVEIMAFPLNVIGLALWLGSMLWLWFGHRKSMFVRFMLSRGAAISSITLLLLFCLVVGLTGFRHLSASWVFLVIILYFQTVLLFVILAGWRKKTATGARLGAVRWRFLFIHAGLLIAVTSAVWGAPDTETLRLQTVGNISVNQAFRQDGTSEWLPYDITLKEFRTGTYPDGTPSMFEAEAVVDGELIALRVNKPVSISFGEEVYLVSGSKDGDSCILQIVREPWKYITAAGIIILMAGAFMLFVTGPRRRHGDDM